MPDSYFNDDVVIVTGGGRGLGETYCHELARSGARVVVNDRDGDAAESTVAAIDDSGGTAIAATAPVDTVAGAATIARAALDEFGTVDAVVCNAGTMSNGLFEDLTEEQLDAMLDVHVKGAFFVTQAVWPTMRQKGHGRVVLVSSSGGLFCSAGRANYAAAKSGVYGLTKSLAYEGLEYNIKVNALLPFANTDIVASAGGLPGHAEGFKPGLVEALRPLRLKEAVAPMVGYLSSRACDVTGEAYSAGMGHFARIFVGAARGWAADSPAGISIGDVAEHIEEIRDLEHFTVPKFIYEQFEAIADTLGLAYGGPTT